VFTKRGETPVGQDFTSILAQEGASGFWCGDDRREVVEQLDGEERVNPLNRRSHVDNPAAGQTTTGNYTAVR
jgi:hypothetical protein